MAVSAFHYTTRVSITDLLGFQYKLERWSQLENIINRVKNSSVSVASEVKDFVLRIEDVDDTDQSENLSFLLEQLPLMVTPSHGRRYSSRTMNVAMNLYLNSKSCYKMLRSENILALPAPKTLQGNIGNFNSMGTDADAEQVSKLVFSHVGQSPNCFIVFDEIYVKPSLRLRGGHIMGYSADRPEELARTILAFMVRLIFPAKKSLSSFLIKFVSTVVPGLSALARPYPAHPCPYLCVAVVGFPGCLPTLARSYPAPPYRSRTHLSR